MTDATDDGSRGGLPPSYRVRCRALHRSERLVAIGTVIVVSGAPSCDPGPIARCVAGITGFPLIAWTGQERFMLEAGSAFEASGPVLGTAGLIVLAPSASSGPAISRMVGDTPLHLHVQTADPARAVPTVFAILTAPPVPTAPMSDATGAAAMALLLLRGRGGAPETCQ